MSYRNLWISLNESNLLTSLPYQQVQGSSNRRGVLTTGCWSRRRDGRPLLLPLNCGNARAACSGLYLPALRPESNLVSPSREREMKSLVSPLSVGLQRCWSYLPEISHLNTLKVRKCKKKERSCWGRSGFLSAHVPKGQCFRGAVPSLW